MLLAFNAAISFWGSPYILGTPGTACAATRGATSEAAKTFEKRMVEIGPRQAEFNELIFLCKVGQGYSIKSGGWY
jgi:hypothetical protein